MNSPLQRVFDVKRLWQRVREKADSKGDSLVQGPLAGAQSPTLSPSEPQKLAIVFYDGELNLVDRGRAVYELHFFNASSLEWRLRDGTINDRARFSIGVYGDDWAPQEWANFPLNIAGDFIKTLVHDSQSQCGFAFQWINNDWPSRYRMFLATHRGSLDQCEKALIQVAYVFAAQKQNEGRGLWTVKVDQSDADPTNPFLWSQIKRDFELRFDGEAIEFSDEQIQLLRIIHCYFMLFYRQRVSLSQNKAGEIEWRFEVPSSSQHERMEAHLQLREWLQGKVAPEEIAGLVGEVG